MRIIAYGCSGGIPVRDVLQKKHPTSAQAGNAMRVRKKNVLGSFTVPLQQKPAVTGKRILLFDDVADTGESLLFVKDYLHSMGIEDITTATIFYKSHSKIKPDFYTKQTSDWIIFPYEVRETINLLAPKWKDAGISDSQIKQRFLEFGFDEKQVEWFMKLQ